MKPNTWKENKMQSDFFPKLPKATDVAQRNVPEQKHETATSQAESSTPYDQKGESSADVMSASDPAMETTSINKESLIIRCVRNVSRELFLAEYEHDEIYKAIDHETTDLLPEGLIAVKFEPRGIPKPITPINSDDLARKHANALCAQKGSGTKAEMEKLGEITMQACRYIEPEILAFFEYYGVIADVKESKDPRDKAYYSNLAKTLYITPQFLDSFSVKSPSDSVHPTQVGSMIHEWGHTFNQLLTRHPDSPFLNIKRETLEQKEGIPVFKRLYRHSKIEETPDGMLIGGVSYEKTQTDTMDTTEAGSSLPFFPSMSDMDNNFFSEYADLDSDEKFSELFRARTGVPLYESRLPKEIPADAKTNVPEDFARDHALQLLPEDRKLVRAFADRYASEPMDRMDRMCAAVIKHAWETPGLKERILNPELFPQRPRPLDVRILGTERAAKVGFTIDQWIQKGESLFRHRANPESQSDEPSSADPPIIMPPSFGDLGSQLGDTGGRGESASTSAKAPIRSQSDDTERHVAALSSQADAPLQPSKGQPVPRPPSLDVSSVELPRKISSEQRRSGGRKSG